MRADYLRVETRRVCERHGFGKRTRGRFDLMTAFDEPRRKRLEKRNVR